MKENTGRAFEQIAATPRGHFALYFNAAVLHLLNFIIGHEKPDSAGLEDLFGRFPFLRHYYSEIVYHVPDGLFGKEATEWWMNALREWEARSDSHLPLLSLVEQAGLTIEHCLGFMLAGLVEEDSRFGTIISDLQASLAQRRLTLEMVGQIVSYSKPVDINHDPWGICNTLIRTGLLDVINETAPRSEWIAKVPAPLWEATRTVPNGYLTNRCKYHRVESFSSFDELIYPPELISRLKNLPGLIKESAVDAIIIRGDEGADPVEVVGTIAKAVGRHLIVTDADTDSDTGTNALLGPLCGLTAALPLIKITATPGETVTVPAYKGYRGIVCYALGLEGGIELPANTKPLTIVLPPADAGLRRRYWLRAFAGRSVADLDDIADRFHLSGGYISKLAGTAVANAELDGRDTVRADDVQRASRALNRQKLDTLADRLETQAGWDRLIVSETTTAKLTELQSRCRQRERLSRNLGSAFGTENKTGVRALFTGASGTGKTLAAKILAAELGMDIYRVDLAAIINKYIGETEKNLHRVLSEAEALDVILLLDEADALLGSRTDVKSANDRYANLETNYLLQRLENYRGIVVATSNFPENVDRAFQRRMDVVAPFVPPQNAVQRLQILELHLPDNHRVPDEYLLQVTKRCALNGGQLRNVAVHAGLLALEDDRKLDSEHLYRALCSEYRKAGAIFPLHNGRSGKRRGIDSFINALAGH